MLKYIAVLLGLLIASPALAHHGVSTYDMGTIRSIVGTVKAWHWQRPHTGITLAVISGDGPETWEIEGAPLRWMQNQGFSADSLKAGDTVTITYHPSRAAPRAGILMHVDMPDGKRLSVNRPAWLGGP